MKYINPYKLFVGSFLPNWLLERTEISLGAKVVYARLAQYAGQDGNAHPKLETIAGEIGLDERQVRRYITELKEQNLIEVKQLGFGKANRYFFLAHQWMVFREDAFVEFPNENNNVDKTVVPDRTDMSTLDRTNVSTPDRTDMSTPSSKRISRRESNKRIGTTLGKFKEWEKERNSEHESVKPLLTSLTEGFT